MWRVVRCKWCECGVWCPVEVVETPAWTGSQGHGMSGHGCKDGEVKTFTGQVEKQVQEEPPQLGLEGRREEGKGESARRPLAFSCRQN